MSHVAIRNSLRSNNGTLYAPRYEEGFLPIGRNGLSRFAPSALPHQKPTQPKTHNEIHSSPATATNSRRRATKHVPRGSPYSHASSVDPGFVEISLACIHAYPHCCCCVACIRFGALFSRQRSFSAFSTVIYICISGFGAVRWCLTLSFP